MDITLQFFSLLTIPNLLREYGSMRNIWEGADEGEGYLRGGKAELKVGLVRNWQVWLMNNIMDEKSFEEIAERDKKHLYLSDIKIYGNKGKAIHALNSGRPLSAFYYPGNSALYYICYRENKLLHALQFQISTTNVLQSNYMAYHRLLPTNVVIRMNKNDSDLMGLLFLPKLEKNGYPKREQNKIYQYCKIDSNWTI